MITVPILMVKPKEEGTGNKKESSTEMLSYPEDI